MKIIIGLIRLGRGKKGFHESGCIDRGVEILFVFVPN
jgi:hypothetical protein